MKDIVKKVYGSIAKRKKKTCCGTGGLCGPKVHDVSLKIGYSDEDLSSVPAEADMGLGCGNPVALATLKQGETVVDLGSGGGLDAFMAAKKVGSKGRVIGIDMTEGMIEKAKENAAKSGFSNVEFMLGDIENMPLDNGIADCVISNCVINLSEDKQNVFNEAFRVLKPGGRLMVSDMVLNRDLPEMIARSARMYAGCVAGALKKKDYLDKIRKAGFSGIEIIKEDPVRFTDYLGSDKVVSNMIAGMPKEDIDLIDTTVVSVKVFARKI